MATGINIFKRGFLSSLAFIIAVGFTPMAAVADTTATTTVTPPPCTAPASTTPGVHQPVGADAAMYTYDCNSGLWVSAHYSYDPNTGLTTPTDPVVYTYNAATGKYNTTVWVYSAPTSSYVAVVQSVSQPPVGATVVGAPQPIVSANTANTVPSSGTETPASSSISGTGPNSNNTITTTGGVGGGNISGTGPNSNNSLGGTATNTLNSNNLTNASVNNLLTGQATTGTAVVSGNTTGGNATTGHAQDLANVVNLLQSSSNALSGSTPTFVANINGNVNGDFLLDPSTLGTIQPAGPNTTPLGTNNLTLNNTTNAAINNNINVGANTGNAAVTNNTTGGNATSGSAQAIANVVNLINSAVSAGKSFVGVININGNLNGDILVPPNFIDQLVASNVPTVTIDTTGPNSNNTITNNNNANTAAITNTNNQGINNQVNSTATTGQATVSGNTTGGGATSGTASTGVTAFNLTGSNLIGSNDLLVFVNVVGKWVGMIVSAPAGATAAELGGGITTDTQNASNNNTTIHNLANAQINNTINAAASTGNASVTGNTSGGNASSGNAKTAVNLLNVQNSSLSLANWFGILFINVFGTWNGSFGINTSAGDPPVTPSGVSIASSAAQTVGTGTTTVPAAVRIFSFVPRASGGYVAVDGSGSSSNVPVTSSASSAVLAAQVTKTNSNGAPTPQLKSARRNLWLPIVSMVLFVLYVIFDRIYYSRRAK